MIKFLHAADLHLDSTFAALDPRQAALRRQEQRRLVTELCRLCRENECDLLLLSGDLFDGRRVYLDTLDTLRDELSECGAQVFIAPGNHDPIGPTSPYLTQAWPENVHIFTNAGIEAILLREPACVVYGAAFTSPSMPPLLRGFRVPEENKDYVNFMVLHGDAAQADSPYNPITKEEIAQSGLTYLALGHTHLRGAPETAGGTVYAWPGCPMGRGFDETGVKGVYLGTADGGSVELRFVPLSVRRYEILFVEAGEDPYAAILEAIPENCAEDIYRIVLTGESEGVDIPALEAALGDRFYALQLRDGLFRMDRLRRDGLGAVHRRAAAEGHDALAGVLLPDLVAGLHVVAGGVHGEVGENDVVKARLGQRCEHLVQQPQRHQLVVRDDEHLLRALLPHEFREAPDAARALDILRHAVAEEVVPDLHARLKRSAPKL